MVDQFRGDNRRPKIRSGVCASRYAPIEGTAFANLAQQSSSRALLCRLSASASALSLARFAIMAGTGGEYRSPVLVTLSRRLYKS